MTVPHRRWWCQCVVSAFRIICVVIPGSPALRFAPEWRRGVRREYDRYDGIALL